MDLTPIAGARILLVEDNEINQQVAREILEGAGFTVTLANNGQEGVDAVKTGQYAAILMDIQMPVMDGYTAAREIREWEEELKAQSSKQKENSEEQLKAQSAKQKEEGSDDLSAFSSQLSARAPRVPIIAMTAHAMAGDAEKSLVAGMNGHVTKPIDPDQLFAELLKWIVPSPRPDEDRPATEVPQPEVVSIDTDLPETLTGFDLAEGLSRLQGNRQLYRKLILTFAVSCRDGIERIKTAIAKANYPDVLQQAHSIKGSAGNLAAKAVQRAAMALEHLVKNNPDEAPSLDALNTAFEELNRAVDILCASVATIGGSPDEDVSPEGDTADGIPPEDRKALAARVREAAEMGDMTELQAIAADLDSQSGSKQSLSRKISALADAFDLDGLGALAADLDSSA